MLGKFGKCRAPKKWVASVQDKSTPPNNGNEVSKNDIMGLE
jgi:hypothetical protein